MKKFTLKSLYEALDPHEPPMEKQISDSDSPWADPEKEKTIELDKPTSSEPPYESFLKFVTSNCKESFMNTIESELMRWDRVKEISNIDFNPSDYTLSAGKGNSKGMRLPNKRTDKPSQTDSSVVVFFNKNAEKALVIATIKPENDSKMKIANVDSPSFKAVEPVLYYPDKGIFIGFMTFVNHTQVILDINNAYVYITYNSIKPVSKQKRIK